MIKTKRTITQNKRNRTKTKWPGQYNIKYNDEKTKITKRNQNNQNKYNKQMKREHNKKQQNEKTK